MPDFDEDLPNGSEDKENDDDARDDSVDQDEEASNVRDDVLEDIRRLQEQAEENRTSGEQLDLDMSSPEDEGDEDTLDDEALEGVQDPERAHDLYYSIRRELMNGLPSGPQNKELRQFVYDEKNLYLNRGKEKDENGIRGSDGRQAYLSHLTTALSVTRNWRQQNGNAIDAYIAFRELNEDAGYRDESLGDLME